MTYLPQLHRALVEGATRLERAGLEGAATPAVHPSQRRGWLTRLLRRLTRGRLFIFAGIGLLAAGSAAAALIALSGRPSAPASGSLHSQAGLGARLQVAVGSYTISVTPDLRGGATGWCIAEQQQGSAPVPIGQAPILRRALTDQRAKDQARLSQLRKPLTTRSRAALVREVDVVIPRLLRAIAMPNSASKALTLRDAYRDVFGVVGGQASDCGVAARPNSSIIADFGQTDESSEGNELHVYTTTLVVITNELVRAVRVSPALTLLTRADPQLPNGYRVAVAVQQTLGKKTQLPIGPDAPAPIALDRQGRPIPVLGKPVALSDQAVFWLSTPHHAHQGSVASQSSPPAACEINTNTIRGAKPEFGEVVQRIHGFPQLATGTYLSCASSDFVYRGQLFVAAILLDARHPGAASEPLPGATPVSGQLQIFSIPTPDGTPSMTARRVGNAWLFTQTNSPLAERIQVLSHLGVCVRIKGRCS